ncbi:putative RNA helicase armi [Habropoda laboriosa]|uniref:RNA helicase n=1 Tax=Habropoda laboriosa TaxID=597456 RepID=A0A0L7REG3_9HYME|nr:putative RNA helicase armi [Habropoda laboriosa]
MNSSTLSSGTLSHSPGQRTSESQESELTSVGNQTSKILNQMKSELQEQKQQDRLLRELHLKRVQSLRKELDYIKATEWRYQPIDRYMDRRYKSTTKGETDEINNVIARIENAYDKETQEDEYSNKDVCYYKTGNITLIATDYIVIDDFYVCDAVNILIKNLKVGDRVYYLASQDNEKEYKIKKIISVIPDSWDNDVTDFEANIVEPQSLTKCVIGKVIERKNRLLVVEPNNISVDLNTVQSEFIPVIGDWLKLESKVEINENSDNLNEEISEVKKIEPLRSKLDIGTISSYDPIKEIETKLPALCNTLVTKKNLKKLAKNKYDIIISDNLNIVLNVLEEANVTVTIENVGNTAHVLHRGCFMIKKAHSQLTLIQPTNPNTVSVLNPSDTLTYIFKCTAKFIGTSKELFIFNFKSFEIGRVFNITVKPKTIQNKSYCKSNNINFNKCCLPDLDEWNQDTYIPGIRPCRPPSFIKVRNATFKVPKYYWDIISQCINEKKSQTECEYDIGNSIPYLLNRLCFESYKDRFHALLYLEEIAQTINMQQYNIESTIMRRSGEYLVMQVPGLAEKRPSLIIGDRAIVSFKWDSSQGKLKKYEGFIHKVANLQIFLKFNHKFQQEYNYEDCQVTFKCSQSTIQRCHNAINMAVHRLGLNFLFPTHVIEKESQLNLENSKETSIDSCNAELKPFISQVRKRKLIWFNKNLNHYQKEAVRNILKGHARPLPYVIFGPPGTGKTITLCETILQILSTIPESRMLIATPSNSSANLIAERLVDSGVLKPSDMVRLIAYHYLGSDSIPNKLLPYCATAELADETTIEKTKYNGVGPRLNCTMNVLGRHRITIGTCISLGILYNMGFPRGHFSHVLVDEAGQATEPEIMIPLNFIHSDYGQVVLAGDPLQLGPVVQSRIAKNFGLDESFLSRLLRHFPYQRDPNGFEAQYDSRLVTKLVINYRSLPEILELSSSLFYDSELVTQVSCKKSKEARLLQTLAAELPKRKNSPPAMIFHGVNGENCKDNDSPSWYNLEEATQVYLYLLKLYKCGLSPDDIGIITPYQKQVIQIRELLMELDVELPKISSVEGFQGQERNVIIISAVRSSINFVNEDIKHSLGFVACPRRLNVAITRARALVIILGNPTLLAQDPYWRSVLIYCINQDSYTGCSFGLSDIEDPRVESNNSFVGNEIDNL